MKKGFSIIEFLIYITILVIAIAAMGLVLSNIFRVGARTDVVQEVSHNGRFAMQRIGQTINEGSGIDIRDGGRELEISFKDRGPILFYIFEENDRKELIIQEEGQDIELTTNRVNIDSIFFKKVSDNSVRIEVKISFYNPQNLPEYEFNNFFTGSFTLKN
ncbi:MAG TPA: hypothetical protein VMV66_00905 [Candidatus Humimicrobiaceae bacterium]|nr:hypothetical protein [Candidatus Humimicrobiaceae bacterium]